jgi:hypothetical protein
MKFSWINQPNFNNNERPEVVINFIKISAGQKSKLLTR